MNEMLRFHLTVSHSCRYAVPDGQATLILRHKYEHYKHNNVDCLLKMKITSLIFQALVRDLDWLHA